MAVEQTLVLVKPDAVRRGLAGEIVARLERRGLVLRAAKLVRVSEDLAGDHYAEHREKPFFGELVEFITSAPTLALVVEGEGAIGTVRSTMGATNPASSAPGTIRGDLALSMPDNLVHGSDAPESAAREIALWFPDDELRLSLDPPFRVGGASRPTRQAAPHPGAGPSKKRRGLHPGGALRASDKIGQATSLPDLSLARPDDPDGRPAKRETVDSG